MGSNVLAPVNGASSKARNTGRTLCVGSDTLTASDVARAARDGIVVELAAEAGERMAAANLIVYHLVGTGPQSAPKVVRATMLVRANWLARATS